MTRHISHLAVLVLLAALTSSAGAQPAVPAPEYRVVRSGFWAEIGGGTGGVWIGCADCDDAEPLFGNSGYIRAGGAFSERVLWGVEAFSLLNESFEDADSAVAVRNVSVAPVVLWYPWQTGFFLKGGVGISTGEVRLQPAEGGATVLGEGTGPGLTFGAGLDVPVLSWLALTANVGAYFGAIGDLDLPDAYVDDVITSMYNANVAFTLR